MVDGGAAIGVVAHGYDALAERLAVFEQIYGSLPLHYATFIFLFLFPISPNIINNYDFSLPPLRLLLHRTRIHPRRLHFPPPGHSPFPLTSSTSPLTQEIMHQLYLYEQGVTDFDYDLFQDSALRLLDHQRNLPLSDILTVLRLGQTHNIRN